MIFIKKYRHKPEYKFFLNLKHNLQNKNKLLKFKKNKWKKLLFNLKSSSKYKKRNCFYKFYDQNSYSVVKFSNYFSKNYKNSLTQKKSFSVLYGGLRKRYVKKVLLRSVKKSNNLKNNVTSKVLYICNINQRLDVILLKANFVLSIRNARQLISHGHVLVNSKIEFDSSVTLNSGDRITFAARVHRLVKYYVVMSNMWPMPPEGLLVNYYNFKITVIDSLLLSKSISEYLDLYTIMSEYKR